MDDKLIDDELPDNYQEPSDSRKVPWTVGDAIAALILVPLIVNGVVFVASFFLIKGKTPSIPTVVGALVFQYIVMFLTVYFIAVVRKGASWSALGFRPFNLLQSLGLVIATYFGVEVLVLIYGAILVLSGAKRPEDPALRVVSLFVKTRAGLALAIFMVAIVAPIMEEFFFRGFIYGAFRKRWGITAAIILTSVLFAVSHLSLFNFIPLTIIGIALAYLYERTGSLGPPIILHALNNFLSVVLLYYSRF